MSSAQWPLAPRLKEALQSVHITPDCLRSFVGQRELEADTPREMRRLLAGALYDMLHAGKESAEAPFLQLQDPVLEEALEAVVPQPRTSAAATIASYSPPRSGPGKVLVRREGIRIWVSPEAIQAADWKVGDTVNVEMSALRPKLSPGFFLIDRSCDQLGIQGTLRIYIHVADPDAAPEVWSQVLQYLESMRVPYQAKILSSKLLYPRRDAFVAYLNDTDANIAENLPQMVSQLPGIHSETPLLAEPLGRGIAWAWEPCDDRPGMIGLSFGQHRAGVLAEAIVSAHYQAMPLEDVIVENFLRANINPSNPARNLTRARTPDRDTQ
ncbi:T3SS effector HopA1 family protein [Spongiactinospora rosea]|uniref:T3SS effector HopA1 family protein n=1 Tax=Spongiactinospora rosea TaxID=2248750 RepID=UPI0011C04A20|nr:T3SS effector HopA1 family protein [Spongiactinospora rosea]